LGVLAVVVLEFSGAFVFAFDNKSDSRDDGSSAPLFFFNLLRFQVPKKNESTFFLFLLFFLDES
jgi:hypothetical protein